MFGVAGVGGGLLGQGQQFDGARLAAVLGLEGRGELPDPGFDGGAALGERVEQGVGDADDFPDGAFPVAGVDVGEGEPEGGHVALDGGVVLLGTRRRRPGGGAWPSRAGQRRVPSAQMAWTLLEMTTWVCRLGSPARESRWSNAVAISPVVSTWATPPAAGAGERGMGVQPPERVGDGLVVGGGDRLGQGARAKAHTAETDFDRGEGEVVTGHGRWPHGCCGDEAGQFAGTCGRRP